MYQSICFRGEIRKNINIFQSEKSALSEAVITDRLISANLCFCN